MPLKRYVVFFAAVMAMGLFAVACATVRYQHRSEDFVQKETLFSFEETPPPHDELKVAVTSDLARAKENVERLKSEKAEEGRYACCVAPACSLCLLRDGECRCRKGLLQGSEICGECLEAWHEGRGNVLDANVEDAERAFHKGSGRVEN